MNFNIVINVFDEGPEQLEACLKNIRTFYKHVVIHIVSDGINNPRYAPICSKYGAKYTRGTYLKRSECGGMWWKRTLLLGRSSKTKWIVKMDLDSRFHRPFVNEPDFPVAGTIENPGTSFENVQGGVQAIRADVADKILNSGILDGAELRYQRLYCPSSEMLKSWVPTGYFTSDHSMMYMLHKFGIRYGNWPEVGCGWKHVPKGRFAATHPHKMGGPRVGVPPNTPLHVITTCKGRLHHLKQTLPRVLREPHVTSTVVDYSCPDGTAAWVRKNHPQVRVVKVDGLKNFHLARARNIGARHTPPGWWCFLDADIIIRPGWADAVRKVLIPGRYHIAGPLQWSMTGSAIFESYSYWKTTGYDEVITGWACEDIDFYTSLRQRGVFPAFWPGNYAAPILHTDEERTKFYTAQKRHTQKISEDYYRRKVQWMIWNWRLPTFEQRKWLLKQTIKSFEGE